MIQLDLRIVEDIIAGQGINGDDRCGQVDRKIAAAGGNVTRQIGDFVGDAVAIAIGKRLQIRQRDRGLPVATAVDNRTVGFTVKRD